MREGQTHLTLSMLAKMTFQLEAVVLPLFLPPSLPHPAEYSWEWERDEDEQREVLHFCSKHIQNTPLTPNEGAKQDELSCQAGHPGHDLIIMQANKCNQCEYASI